MVPPSIVQFELPRHEATACTTIALDKTHGCEPCASVDQRGENARQHPRLVLYNHRVTLQELVGSLRVILSMCVRRLCTDINYRQRKGGASERNIHRSAGRRTKSRQKAYD